MDTFRCRAWVPWCCLGDGRKYEEIAFAAYSTCIFVIVIFSASLLFVEFLFLCCVKKIFLYNFSDYHPLSSRQDVTNIQIYIILLDRSAEINQDDISEIFKYFWETSYITAVIILVKKSPCYSVYRYNPFTQASCRQVSFEEKLICKITDLQQMITQSTKKENLNRCPINCLAWNEWPPYSSFEGDKLVFFEGKVLNEFSEWINSTIIAKPLDVSIFQNEPFDVINKTSDIFCGEYVLTSKRANNFSFSFPHDRSTMVMFLTNDKVTKTSLEILLAPFDYWSWTMLCLSWLSGTVSLKFMTNEDITSVCLMIFSLILGAPVMLVHSKFNIRLQYLTWIFLGFTFSIVHHGVFFSILQSSLLRPLPNTFDKIIRTNYSRAFLTDEFIFTDILKDNQDIVNANMSYTVQHPNQIFDYMLYTKHKVVGVSTSRIYEYRTKNDSDLMYRLSERFMTIFYTIYFTKNSFLVNDMNKMVLDLYGGGILEKWMVDTVGERRKKIRSERVRKLSLMELGGIFEIYGVLILFSSAVFIGEIGCYYHYKFRS